MADTKELTEWLTTAAISPDVVAQLALNVEYLVRGCCPFVSGDDALIEHGLLTPVLSDSEVRLTPSGYLLAEQLGLLRADYRYPSDYLRVGYSEATVKAIRSSTKDKLRRRLVGEP